MMNGGTPKGEDGLINLRWHQFEINFTQVGTNGRSGLSNLKTFFYRFLNVF